jgi:hypothetical protein
MFVLIIIGGSVAVFIGVYIGMRYLNRQRTQALNALAASLSFTFSEKGDGSLTAQLSVFHLFSQGYARRIANVFTGKFNLVPVTVMDYKYTTGGGKDSHTWQQTVLVMDCEKLQLPRFILHPENIFDKIGSVFGRKDINFDTAPVFSKRYFLRGDNEAAVRALFNTAVLGYFEQHPGLSMECDGVRLIFYRTSKRVPPDKFQTFLQEGYDAFSLFKVR